MTGYTIEVSAWYTSTNPADHYFPICNYCTAAGLKQRAVTQTLANHILLPYAAAQWVINYFFLISSPFSRKSFTAEQSHKTKFFLREPHPVWAVSVSHIKNSRVWWGDGGDVLVELFAKKRNFVSHHEESSSDSEVKRTADVTNGSEDLFQI